MNYAICNEEITQKAACVLMCFVLASRVFFCFQLLLNILKHFKEDLLKKSAFHAVEGAFQALPRLGLAARIEEASVVAPEKRSQRPANAKETTSATHDLPSFSFRDTLAGGFCKGRCEGCSRALGSFILSSAFSYFKHIDCINNELCNLQ